MITCGGLQSNHCRAVAVACAQLGLKAHLLLRSDLEVGDQSLITWRGLQNGRGGADFSPTKKGGGVGAEQVLAMLRVGAQKVLR